MISHYSELEISDALENIGLKKGDLVFSHSNVGFLGIPKNGTRAEDIFITILNSFLNVIGDQGTLIVPTFTYSFPHNKIFDPDNTPSNCGIFTEMLRKHPNAYRSNDPCVSVAAIGKRAQEMIQEVPVNAFGPDSFFDRFYQNNGIICNINFDAGSTFIHYVERVLNVPYRIDKTFSGIFQKNGEQENRHSTLFARKISDGLAPKYEIFSQLAKENNFYKTAKVGRGFIGAITAKNMFSLIKKTLPTRPWFLTEAEILGITPNLIINVNNQVTI